MDTNSNLQIIKKDKIKKFYIEIDEDKFTKIKTVNCLHKIEWKSDKVANTFMVSENSYSHSLALNIDYRHVGEVDSVFFVFQYLNVDDGYPGMNNLNMYLILDDDKTICLDDVSGTNCDSQNDEIDGVYYTYYFEAAQLSVSINDMIAIANAKKIEYSIRFGKGRLDGVFTLKDTELNIIKGFYNATFDDDFELDQLYNGLVSAGY